MPDDETGVPQVRVKTAPRVFSALLALAAAATGAAEPVPAFVVENYAIPEPLTAEPGDPERGLAVITDRELGNCLGCHDLPIDAEFMGTTGPSLAGVADRLSPAQLRLRVVDSKQINPFSMMPSYYRTDGLHRVMEKFRGRTVLSAQQVEDVIAYLSTLRREDEQSAARAHD